MNVKLSENFTNLNILLSLGCSYGMDVLFIRTHIYLLIAVLLQSFVRMIAYKCVYLTIVRVIHITVFADSVSFWEECSIKSHICA